MVIGNPPFLGGKLLITHLGEDYVSRMFKTYAGRVPAEADLVCYWFEKAGRQIATGRTRRAGLVATNSIRGGANRRALEAATHKCRPHSGGGRSGALMVREGGPTDRQDQSPRLFEAWSDEPWVIDGAAVRVSLVCFSRADDASASYARLDGQPVDEIYSDLTARRGSAGVDLTAAQRLPQNAGVAFMGDTKGGPFDVAGGQAREWLRLPANPNGRTNADVLKPWVNGLDLTRRPAGKWIVDFGWTMSAGDAALYEEPFGWVKERVHPMRLQNRRAAYREYWWRHVEPRQGMWRALAGLSRYIATARVAKHRLFGWYDARICPRLATDRGGARRLHDLRHPAQPVSRALVAPSLHLAREGQRPALHAEHHLRDVPVPARFDAGRPCKRLRRLPAGQGCSPGSPTASRAARPLAQPA